MFLFHWRIVGAALRRDLRRVNHKNIAPTYRGSYARIQLKLTRMRDCGSELKIKHSRDRRGHAKK